MGEWWRNCLFLQLPPWQKFTRGTPTLAAAHWLTETSFFLKHITEIRVSEKLKLFYLSSFCSPRHCLWFWITKTIQMKQVLFLPNILQWHQFVYSWSFQQNGAPKLHQVLCLWSYAHLSLFPFNSLHLKLHWYLILISLCFFSVL